MYKNMTCNRMSYFYIKLFRFVRFGTAFVAACTAAFAAGFTDAAGTITFTAV